MADASWDTRSVVEQLAAWKTVIRAAVLALPPEARTNGAEVVRLLLGQSITTADRSTSP